MANANQSDFLGEGVTSGVKAGTKRATTADGLYYLDTGEPTPIAIRRIQAGSSLQPRLSADQRAQYAASEKAALFNPTAANAESVAAGGKAADFKFDKEKGQYYTEAKNGRRTYITNDPLRAQQAEDTPIFTANDTGSAKQDYTNVFRNAAGLAATGSAGGAPGVGVGAVVGGLSGLPQAQGRGIQLTAGSGAVPGRQGTAAEATQANANYRATGSSLPPGGGTNYFPQSTGTGGAGTGAVTRTDRTAVSPAAQRIIDQAAGFSTQNQQRANDSYGQATAAATRAAPQMAMPSSANQQAVYDRAMGFQAQSGAAAIRAERADVSGAGRLENMQMDMQGVNNLEGFQNTQSAQGVNALYGFNPNETFKSASELAAFTANNTAEGANAVAGFRPSMVQQDAEDLRRFQADRSGIDRLNAYADEAQGPSAAQAMLRSQADADKRTMLAISRSGRGNSGGVQAQRQAMTEGGLIAAETRGQGAALAAQETEAYKGRQLQALAQAGSLISQAEAQRLTAMSQAGQLMSAADAQKLSALQAYGQLKAQQDNQILSAKQSAGSLNANAEGMLLNATSNAAQLQGDMDSRTLSAVGQAAGLRTQQDSIRSNNLQTAGNIRLSGSEINQRGAIAASSADLQAQALNLQSLSLAGQVSSDIRNQDIQVLRSNLDASLQTMGLNDQQVRFFTQAAQDREVANQNMQMNASQFGVNTQTAQEALDQQWAQIELAQLTQNQRNQYNQQVLAQNQGQIDYGQGQQNRQNDLQFYGSLLTAGSTLFAPSSSNTAQAVAGTGFRPGLSASSPTASNYSGYGQLPQQNLAGQSTATNANGGTQSGQNAMGMVFDPFTNQWVYP